MTAIPGLGDERGESCSEENAGRLREAVRKAPMAAWNIVLGGLKESNDPKQQYKHIEAVSGVAEAERGSDRCEGGKPLQADRSRCNGPELDRRKSENRNGTDEQPCEPAEEDLGCHGWRFSRLCCACAWLFCASDAAHSREDALVQPKLRGQILRNSTTTRQVGSAWQVPPL
jgi:hypothetical protein